MLEIMVTVGVAAVAIALAVPSASDMVQKNKAMRDATLIALQAREARELALRTGSSIRFRVDADSKKIELTQMALDCTTPRTTVRTVALSTDARISGGSVCFTQTTGDTHNGQTSTFAVRDVDNNAIINVGVTSAGLVTTTTGSMPVAGVVNEVSAAQKGAGVEARAASR